MHKVLKMKQERPDRTGWHQKVLLLSLWFIFSSVDGLVGLSELLCSVCWISAAPKANRLFCLSDGSVDSRLSCTGRVQVRTGGCRFGCALMGDAACLAAIGFVLHGDQRHHVVRLQSCCP